MQNSTEKQHIDDEGYRKNVGIIVCNNQRQVLWARRARHDGWQFPQGGINPDESALEAVFRELYEEIGLATGNVKLLGKTENWLRYDVPYTARRCNHLSKQFRGQKQQWFLFHLLARETCVKLDTTNQPEFDCWRWVEYWQPLQQIVAFKRAVYKEALTELEPFLEHICA